MRGRLRRGDEPVAGERDEGGCVRAVVGGAVGDCGMRAWVKKFFLGAFLFDLFLGA